MCPQGWSILPGVAGAPKPAYFILLELADGRVSSIRDFRYVPYIATEAEFESLGG